MSVPVRFGVDFLQVLLSIHTKFSYRVLLFFFSGANSNRTRRVDIMSRAQNVLLALTFLVAFSQHLDVMSLPKI